MTILKMSITVYPATVSLYIYITEDSRQWTEISVCHIQNNTTSTDDSSCG